MTDLHCHILPGIDDGAKTVEMSLELLHKEKEDGVVNIMFTSHFNYERISVDEYLLNRQNAFEKLKAAVGKDVDNYNFKLGAEVFFSPGLREIETDKLCLGDTNFILLEFPTDYKPLFIKEIMYDLQSQGIIPLIAHVERYPYVWEDLKLLYDWINAGAYIQMNAGSLLRSRKTTKRMLKLIEWNMVHVIVSDAHSMERRSPKLRDAFGVIEAYLGREKVERLKQNAEDLFYNREPDIEEPHFPRKFLGKWY